MNRSDNKFLIVGGHGRSGTTLLQGILNSHMNIYGGTEFGYLPLICDTKKRIESSVNSRNKLDEYFDVAYLNECFEKLIRNLFGNISNRNDVRIISEKSPLNVRCFADLHEIITDSKFIFVVRDPRAIYASAKKVRDKALNKGASVPSYSKDVFHFVKNINEIWSYGFEFYYKNPESCMLVFYEDLVTKPEDVTREVCNFLEIDWDENMLNHKESMNNIIKENEKSAWGGAELYHKNIHTKSLKKWEKLLSRKEKYLIVKYLLKNKYINKKYFNDQNYKRNYFFDASYKVQQLFDFFLNEVISKGKKLYRNLV